MTNYDLVLCAKLVAVLGLIALAAVNRYALTPRIVARDGIAARRLVRSISVELLFVVVVLGLVATWRFTPPPRSLIAVAEAPVHIHIHGDQAMADLTIELAGVAGRRITVTVLDGQFGRYLRRKSLYCSRSRMPASNRCACRRPMWRARAGGSTMSNCRRVATGRCESKFWSAILRRSRWKIKSDSCAEQQLPRMTANGMVRPCSRPASKGSWQGAPKTRSTPCHTSSILESP